jgi:hypothetical protein
VAHCNERGNSPAKTWSTAKTETVKLTFTCTVVLKAELERYAAMHARTYGESVDAITRQQVRLMEFVELFRA